MARLGLGVTWLVGPLTGAGFALGDTRLVRVEACLNQPRDGGELVEGGVIQFANRDAQAVNLGERRLAGYERPGDAAALFEQPIRVMARAKHGGLDCPCLAWRTQRKPAGVRRTRTQSGPSIAPSASTTMPRLSRPRG